MHPLKILILLLLSFPAAAQTLSSPTIQLHEGSLLPAASPVLENPSGTLRLERGTLGALAAGSSATASGIQFTGGLSAVARAAQDADSDGVPDIEDNCPATPNPDQLDSDTDSVGNLCDNCVTVANAGNLSCDSDLDGFGNLCDGDFNNDLTSDGLDFSSFTNSSDFLTDFVAGVMSVNVAGNPTGSDMNCSGAVDGLDFSPHFLIQFLAGNPGPSGFSCAGSVPCPAP